MVKTTLDNKDNNEQLPIIQQFNSYINSRDIKGLATLMTDGHTFIDSANTTFKGKENVLKTWNGFFELFPDYKNVFEKFLSHNNTVVIIGRSICSDKRLDGPALWTVKLEDGKVAEWRVYEDNPENRKLLGTG